MNILLSFNTAFAADNFEISKITKTSSTGEQIDITSASTTAISPSQVINIEGTAIPGSTIRLVIRPKEITKEVVADAEGTWSFKLYPKLLKLPMGQHSIEAIVVEDALASLQVVKFDLKKISSTEEAGDEDFSNYHSLNFSGIANYFLIGSLVVILGGFIVLKRNPLT